MSDVVLYSENIKLYETDSLVKELKHSPWFYPIQNAHSEMQVGSKRKIDTYLKYMLN